MAPAPELEPNEPSENLHERGAHISVIQMSGKRVTARAFAVALVATSALTAVALVVAFYWAACHRLRYPFDLEWMEGAMADHVLRLRHGQPLYVAPTADFVPFVYNPLFYVAAAPFTVLFGDYAGMRLLSLLAATASLVLVAILTFRESRTWLSALLAAGVYAGTYPLTGGWFDVGRVDSLFVALSLGALLAGRVALRPRGLVLCAGLSVLAFATKQTGVALIPALAVALAMRHGVRRALWYVVPATVTTLALVLALVLASSGWYWFYAFEMPASHALVPDLYTNFWRFELFPTLPVAVVLGLLYFVASKGPALGSGGATGSGGRVYFGITTAAMVAMAFASRIHNGSYLNDIMPAHAALAVWFGLGAGAIENDVLRWQSGRGRLFVAAIALCQLAVLLYDPRAWVPSHRDAVEGRRVVDAIRRYPGDVLVTHHPTLARMVGKRTFASEMAVFDVMRTAKDSRGAKDLLRRSFAALFHDRQVSAVITDDRPVLADLLTADYREVNARFVRDASAFRPKSGVSIRPTTLYEPK